MLFYVRANTTAGLRSADGEDDEGTVEPQDSNGGNPVPRDSRSTESENGAGTADLQDSSNHRSPADSSSGEVEDDACTEDEADFDDASLPSYDSLRPRPPPLSGAEATPSTVGKQSSPENAQAMNAYLQQRNRDLYAENERLKEELQRAKDARGCYKCEEREPIARENALALATKSLQFHGVQVRESSLQKTVQRQQEALQHAEARIKEMRPVYEKETDPVLKLISFSQADDEAQQRATTIERMGVKLRRRREKIDEYAEKFEEKDVLIRDLRLRIDMLKAKEAGDLEYEETLLALIDTNFELQTTLNRHNAEMVKSERASQAYGENLEILVTERDGWRDECDGVKAELDRAKKGLMNLTEQLCGKVLQE